MRYLILGFTMGFLSFLTGCKEETVVPLKGDIVGFVTLLDEYGSELADKSGVKVTLRDGLTARTDARGKFNFNGVNVGTYNLLFEKEGFGKQKMYSFTVAGGSKPAAVSGLTMLQFPSIEVISVNAKAQTNLSVNVSGTTSLHRYHNFFYYFGKTSTVSNHDFEFSSGYSTCCIEMTGFNHYFSVPAEIFRQGEKIYMVIYAVSDVSKYGAYSYYDYELEKYINASAKRLTSPIELILK